MRTNLLRFVSRGIIASSLPLMILSTTDIRKIFQKEYPKTKTNNIDVNTMIEGNDKLYVVLFKDMGRALFLFFLFMPCAVLYPLYHFNLIDHIFFTTLKYTFELAGPTFVKIGQWMSTRNDMFSNEFCLALSDLQSNVRPENCKVIKKILEKEIGCPIHHEFSEFIDEPLGAGCIAQVHRGTIRGQLVAIKIQRPNVIKTVKQDLRLMSYFQDMFFSDRLLFESIATMMLMQIDFRNEAIHLEKFNNNFKKTDVIFPKPIFATESILVETLEPGQTLMSYIKTASYENKKEICYKISDVFLQMIIKDNYIHGDMHPGNILVTQNNDIVLLDAGIVIDLDKSDQKNLLDLIVLIGNKQNDKIGHFLIEKSPDKGQSMSSNQKDKFIKEIISIKKELDLLGGEFDSGKGLVKIMKIIQDSNLRLPYSLTSTILSITLVNGICNTLYDKMDTINSITRYLIFN